MVQYKYNKKRKRLFIMNKEIKVSEYVLNELEQSVLRYDLMKRDLEKNRDDISNKLAISWCNNLLSSLNELSGIVDDLKNNVPIWSEIGKAFISDINNLWRDYQDVKKKYSL